ncbi:hypothetical protein [Pelomonas sp. KK5]|uniref:hypothetical protein n=1 Tax=Pelomonas sp. KK5 TaxID=1855730 RepID=UPI0009F87BE7|nr:hypothetical protein [Pelomonas sp. KK5]
MPLLSTPPQPWAPFPYLHPRFLHDDPMLRRHWPRLHAGDAEHWPRQPALVQAWRLLHAGQLHAAFEAGLAAAEAGSHAGLTVANKAQASQAFYVERQPRVRHRMYLAVAERAARQQVLDPECPNAYFWQAWALGRYAQGIGVAKGIGHGLGPRIRAALATTIELAPQHAGAHLALGLFHAEIIDKLGRLLARTQRADAAIGLAMLQRAAVLDAHSPLAKLELAQALRMLDGASERRQQEIDGLEVDAAATAPLDALECFGVEAARARIDADDV